MEEFDSNGAHPNWPEHFFRRLLHSYRKQTSNSGALVGNARTFLMDARGLLEFALDVMSAVAHDADAAHELLEA